MLISSVGIWYFNPLPSYEGRQSVQNIKSLNLRISIHSPHTRGDTTTANTAARGYISIHSPHTRGDSINFQRIHRIQGSLYNTIHFTRFREFFQSVSGRKNAVYAVRSSPENHDSFTFAQPLRIRRYSLIWQATPCGICSVSTLT